MESKEYIAAIDLGSSKIIGMVGLKRADHTLEVVAVDKIESQTCIRRGTIHNLEETTLNLKHILRKLDNRITPSRITKIYVSVGGQSIHTVDHKVNTSLGDDEFVTDKIVDRIINECFDLEIDNCDVLEVIPNEFKLDGKKTEKNPIGVACSELESNLKLIVGRSSLKRNIDRAIEDKLGVDIAGYSIAQMAGASLLLSDADKTLGSALIDFGAGTTSVIIYKDGLMRHLAVIPFGGNSITRDICSVNMLEADAEKLKTTYGSAIFNPEADNKSFPTRSNGGLETSKIDLHTLNSIIEARMSEIIHNVWEQIQKSGFAKQLGAGIHYTGGASQTRSLSELIKRITGIDAKKAVTTRAITNTSTSTEAMQNPAYSVVLGMLISGDSTCVKVEHVHVEPTPAPVVEEKEEKPDLKWEKLEKVEAPKKTKKPLWGSLSAKMGSLFGDNDSQDNDTELK